MKEIKTEISNLETLIEMFDLRSKERHIPKVFRRAYLYHVLNQRDYTLHHIGKIFQKDHATVLNGLRKHEKYTITKDKLYKMYCDELSKLIEFDTETNLITDILKCENMKELDLIKKRIERNYYL